MNHRPQLALARADTLLTESEIQLLGTPTVMSLLTSALISRPRQFAPHLLRALRGPDQVAEQAGQAWAAALLRDVLSPPLPAELAGLSAAARRGAATLLASYPIEGLPPPTPCAPCPTWSHGTPIPCCEPSPAVPPSPSIPTSPPPPSPTARRSCQTPLSWHASKRPPPPDLHSET
jgi:hypothetical protein